jgi:hypothetical protein
MNHLHADRLGFAFEPQIGRASRWNTMRAMRVLRWSELSLGDSARRSDNADST